MVTYITMAIGALGGVALLAGLTGAMPSPQALRSQSDETWPPEPEIDSPTESPVSITIPQLPREIVDATGRGIIVGKCVLSLASSIPNHSDARRSWARQPPGPFPACSATAR
jgi:hypothetical protein